MSLFDKFAQFFGGEQKQALTLSDSTWGGGSVLERLGLSRTNSRVRYTESSIFEAYRVHELVFSCVNKIADVQNDAEIIVEKKNGKGEWERVEGHGLPAIFKRPNSLQTGRDIRRLMVQSEQGAGRFVIILNRSGAGIPVEMEIVNPNRIKPKFDRQNDKIIAYAYTRKDGREVMIKPEDVLIRRRVDLLDQFYGFAPAQAALKSVNSDLGLTDYVDAFFESDGTPSGILKILNASLNDTRKEEISAKWRSKYSRGGSNQKGIAVLDQNLDFEKIGSNLDELASESLSDRFESRICSVFGVPPILVGALVGLRHTTNNATARAALRDFWDNKINPEMATLREWFTWFVLPEFENIEDIKADKVRVGWDISQCAFLQEDVNEVSTRARENFKAGFMTVNEAREAVKLPPDPKGDYYLQPSMVQPITPENQAILAMEKVEAGKPEGEQPPIEETPKALPPTTEKKTFELDGLTLSREPNAVETLIGLKSLVADFESEKEKAAKIFNQFRAELIESAISTIGNLTPETVHELILSADAKTVKKIRKTLQSAHTQGRAQVASEIEAQKNQKNHNNFITKDLNDDDDDFIFKLTNIWIAKIINEIQSRAVNWYVALATLGTFTRELLEEKLKGESESFINQAAGISVNAAIQTGRRAEMDARRDEIKYFVYSAILDKNTCESCKEADEKQADNADDLPDAPNPECDGGVFCRCFIVAVVT